MARVTCPQCKKTGNVPNEFMGQRIKCPSCGYRFASPTLTGPVRSPAPAPAKPVDVDIEPVYTAELIEEPRRAPVPARVEAAALVPTPAMPPAQPEKKACPFCGEEIMAVAKKCRYCNETLDPVLRSIDEARNQSRHAQGAQQVVVVNSVNAMPIMVVDAPSKFGLMKLGITLFLVGLVITFMVPPVGAPIALIGVLIAVLGLALGITRTLFG